MDNTVTEPAPASHEDDDAEATYHLVTPGKVACSVPLSALVIADYIADGSVRGLEFLGKPEMPMDAYIALARKASQGAARKSRGPIPGLDQASSS